MVIFCLTRDIFYCVSHMVPSYTLYIDEYMSRISALCIQPNLNYLRKTLLCLSNDLEQLYLFGTSNLST